MTRKKKANLSIVSDLDFGESESDTSQMSDDSSDSFYSADKQVDESGFYDETSNDNSANKQIIRPKKQILGFYLWEFAIVVVEIFLLVYVVLGLAGVVSLF